MSAYYASRFSDVGDHWHSADYLLPVSRKIAGCLRKYSVLVLVISYGPFFMKFVLHIVDEVQSLDEGFAFDL